MTRGPCGPPRRSARGGAEAARRRRQQQRRCGARVARAEGSWATPFRSKISLLAFEEPEWAELTSPQLSVIRQPVKAIAREAWELLLRRMHGETFPVQRLELRAEIELRDSVQAVRRERRRA